MARRLSSLVVLLAAAVNVWSAPARFSPRRRDLSQAVYNCDHDFAYTWDDGPYVDHQEIQNAFDSVGGKTTFFVNGNNWSCIYDEANVQRLRASYEAGHLIASHTWSHAAITTLSNADIDREILRLDEALIKILGVRPKFMRPPYGDINDATATYIQQTHGKRIIMWSADSGDSTGGSASDSYNFYKGFADAGPGQPHLTLSHETEPAGIGALRMGTVPLLANAGINLVTVAQCIDEDPYEYVGGYGQRDSTWTCSGTWNPPTTTSSTTSVTRTSSTTPTSTSSAQPSCVSTYYSVAGDTCVSIGSSYGISGDAILSANTFLNCSDIWTGTPICIPPPGTVCQQRISSLAGDTCATVGARYGVSADTIQLWNWWINCNDIWTDTSLCVRH